MMLNNVYNSVKWDTLDNIITNRNKCICIINSPNHPVICKYINTAKKYLPMYDEAIIKRRAAGELTIQEQLYKITGNVFEIGTIL
jgi:hypothetical protein